MLFFLVCVIVVIVFCGIGACRGGSIFPHVARVEVIDPVFDRTDSAGDDLPHGAFAWSYCVAVRERMQQVVHEVTSQAALLYWMQWYTNSLLDFEDESLSRLCPRVVLLRGVRPEILRRQEPGSTQLTNHRSLHRRSRWVDVLCSTILLGLEAHKMWNLGRGNLFSWCV